MLWKVIERTVQIVFLTLATTMLFERWTEEQSAAQLNALKKEVVTAGDSSLRYYEGRVNTLQAQQDSYQLGVSNRLSLIEERVRVLEQENRSLKVQQRINNTNLNYNNQVVKLAEN